MRPVFYDAAALFIKGDTDDRALHFRGSWYWGIAGKEAQQGGNAVIESTGSRSGAGASARGGCR